MEVKLPANWDEIITSDKYLDVIKVLQTPYATDEAMKVALFRELTGYNMQMQFDNVPLENTSLSELFLSATLVDEVFPMLEFITNRTPFLKNPLPVIVHNEVTYKGPEERLMNQTGEEWSISHNAEHLYKKTKDKKHLVDLIAANYHDVIIGVRTSFDERSHERTAKEMTTLPEAIIYGAYLWYQHADEWWSKRFPDLFSSSPSGAAGAKATGLEVRDIIFELAGNKLDDAWDKLQKRSRQDIIYALNRLESRRE